MVVDNGVSDEVRALVADFPGVVYATPGENLGSAGGVAFGLQRLHALGFDWLYSVDDDTPPLTHDTLEKLEGLILRHEHDEPRVGIVGVVGSRWDWRTGEQRRLRDDELAGDLDVDIVGGGQQFVVRRDVLDTIGPPPADFFFGHWDPMWCLAVRRAGYRVVVDGDLMREYRQLAGRLGLTTTRVVVPMNSSAGLWRRYYVSRNYVYSMRTTFGRPDLARREAGKALLRSITSWRRGVRFGARFSMLQLRGIVDGYRGKLGMTVSPGDNRK